MNVTREGEEERVMECSKTEWERKNVCIWLRIGDKW